MEADLRKAHAERSRQTRVRRSQRESSLVDRINELEQTLQARNEKVAALTAQVMTLEQFSKELLQAVQVRCNSGADVQSTYTTETFTSQQEVSTDSGSEFAW